MNTDEIRETRTRVCAGLSGVVLEVGFGSGRNLPYLQQDVTVVLAVDPSPLAIALSATRRDQSSSKVSAVIGDGRALPFRSASADCALSTWSLCSIPNPARAVAEIRRVLRPGGTLHFVEHGLAPDQSIRRWQRRVNRVRKQLTGGCDLTGDLVAILISGGMKIDSLDRYYASAGLKLTHAICEGTASPA
jgi:SAM-dependent methyltransferase